MDTLKLNSKQIQVAIDQLTAQPEGVNKGSDPRRNRQASQHQSVLWVVLSAKVVSRSSIYFRYHLLNGLARHVSRRHISLSESCDFIVFPYHDNDNDNFNVIWTVFNSDYVS